MILEKGENDAESYRVFNVSADFLKMSEIVEIISAKLGRKIPPARIPAALAKRIVKFGANSLHYQAYPGSVGTDEFAYTVTDQQGATASGTVRVAVVPPGTPQPPLAVPDTVTVEAGRTAQVEALANDLIAAGDQVSIELVDPPEDERSTTPLGTPRAPGPWPSSLELRSGCTATTTTLTSSLVRWRCAYATSSPAAAATEQPPSA